MRRMVGAAILIVALGGGSVVSWWPTRGTVVPADSARVTFVAPLPDSSALPATLPAARAATIDYLPDPLAFLSSAPADSLELLPGVGPVLATRLVAARHESGRFRSWDEVDRVRGIGQRTIERLQSLSHKRRR